MELKYSNIAQRLAEVIPELRSEIEELRAWWGDEEPGPHVVFGDVLYPFLVSLLDSTTDKDEVLTRIFSLLEDMAASPDVHVQEVVAFSICEHLLGNTRRMERSHAFLGENTAKLCHDVESQLAKMGKRAVFL